MKKTKVMITGFAVFAAFLMLMTTAIARPLQEKTNIDAVEDLEQDLMSSLEVLNTKLTRDCEANTLIKSLVRNRDVAAIISSIETASSEEEILSSVEQLADVLQDRSEFEQLIDFLEIEYLVESEEIIAQIESLLIDMNEGDDDIQTNDCLEDFIYDIIMAIIAIIMIIEDLIQCIKNLITTLTRIITMIRDFLEWLFGGSDDGGTLA